MRDKTFTDPLPELDLNMWREWHGLEGVTVRPSEIEGFQMQMLESFYNMLAERVNRLER
jgi:hypothetical protein